MPRHPFNPVLQSLAALPAFVLSALAAAQTQAPSSTSNLAGPALGSAQHRVPMQPAAVPLGQQNGVLFYAEGEPEFVGWTFDVDASTGAFKKIKPLFTASYNDNTGPGDYKLEIENYLGSSYKFSSLQIDANVAYSAGLVNAALQFAYSNEVMTNTFGGTLAMTYSVEYPSSIVDMLGLPLSALHPDAQAVLSITNPYQKAQAWKAAGFGPLIAIGYDLKGAAGLKATFSSMDTWTGKDNFVDLKMKWGNGSGSTTLASHLKEGLDKKSVEFSVFTDGLATPPSWTIPTLADLADNAKSTAWEQQVLNSAKLSKKRSGLWLAPASILSGGPDVSMPVWDGQLVALAGTSAADCIETLSIASAYNSPYALVNFLDVRPMPGTTTTYGLALKTARLDLVTQLDLLAYAVKQYLQGENSTDPVIVQHLKDEIASLDIEQAKLNAVLVAIDGMVDTLPAITVKPLHPQDLGGNYWGNLVIDLEIDNVAVLGMGGLDEDWVTKTFTLLETTPVSAYHSFANDDLSYPMVLNYPSTTPGADGLRKLRVKFMAEIWAGNLDYYLNFKDQFNRTGTAHWNLNWY